MRALDAVVLGAGPAGAAAAIELARAGADVVLLDRAVFPRDKCCGDGLTTSALRHLEALGLEPTTVASFTVSNGLQVRSDDGRSATLLFGDRSGIRGALARRIDLDAALVARAETCGARLLERQSARALVETSKGVEIETSEGTKLLTRAVVAADGAWSSTRRLLEPDHEAPRPQWTAFRAYVTSSLRDTETLHVLFDKAFLPGYAWCFPFADGSANVGVYVRRNERAGHGLRDAWERTLADPYLSSLLGRRAVLNGQARAWPVPTELARPSSGLGGRILFAGDALGAADPFTGEGIAQALESGRLAGRSIADGAGDPAAIASSYEERLQMTLRRERRIAGALSGVFARPFASRAAVAIASSGRRSATVVGRFLYEDTPRSAFFSPASLASALRGAPAPYPGRAGVTPS